MQRYKVNLPFMQLTFAYNGKTLYKVTKDPKGIDHLSTFKGGTIEECLAYVSTIYKIDRGIIKEID